MIKGMHRALSHKTVIHKKAATGIVWCVSVESENIITRRQGKVTVMGNCTGFNYPPIDLIGTFRPFASTPLYKQALGRGTRPIAPVDSFDTAEARRDAIAASLKPSCKVITPFWENASHNLASPSVLITDDEDERRAIDKERKAGSRVDLAQLEMKLKAKRMADKDEEMRKYAEKVANSQARKARGELYIADILRTRNPSHKMASDAFVRYVRKAFGVNIPPGEYSAYQIMRIKERAEKAKAI